MSITRFDAALMACASACHYGRYRRLMRVVAAAAGCRRFTRADALMLLLFRALIRRYDMPLVLSAMP